MSATLTSAAHPPRGLPLPYLLGAAALHLLILSLPLRPAVTSALPAASLQVSWQRPPGPSLAPAIAAAQLPHPAADPTALAGRRRPLGTETEEVAAQPTPAATADNILPPSASGTLLDHARQQIRQEGRASSAYRQAQRHGYQDSEGSEPSSALGQALHQAPAGEQRLANGILRITNPDGSTYCLRENRDLRQRDTPVELLAVPSTCP